MTFFSMIKCSRSIFLEHLKVFLKGDSQHTSLASALVRILESPFHIAPFHETLVKKCSNNPRKCCMKLRMHAYHLIEQGRWSGHQIYSFTGPSDPQGRGQEILRRVFFLENSCLALLAIRNLLSQHRSLFLSHSSTSLLHSQSHRLTAKTKTPAT